MTGATTLKVSEGASGARLDRWAAASSGKPRAEVQRLIELGLVRVDGQKVPKATRVVAGQVVEIAEPGPVAAPALPDVEVPVRFEDRHLAVVAKPAGLVVHRAGRAGAATLVDVLARRMPLAAAAGEHRRGIVHRLDKGTSGLLVVAKTDEAYHGLVARMKARAVRRTYRALVIGRFSLPTGRIEAPLGRSPHRPTSMTVSALGREAVTEFEVVEDLGELSLLAVRLLTGRTHQIRVHLAHIDHPVVGDRQYGAGSPQLAAGLGLTRPFLHAYSLELEHPVTGEMVRVEEPLPPDLHRALRAARVRAGAA